MKLKNICLVESEDVGSDGWQTLCIKHCNAIYAINCIEVNVDQLNLQLLQPKAWDEMNCLLLLTYS